MEDMDYIWIGRFFIWGGDFQLGFPASITYFDKDMEKELWSIEFTHQNIIRAGYLLVFLFVVGVAIYGEFFR